MKHEAFHDEEAMEIAKFLSDYNMQKGSIDERYIPYVTEVGQAMYDEGYRKQSVGEWMVYGNCNNRRAMCTNCKKEFAVQKGMLQLHRFPFCPLCGARMKGEEE